MIYCPSGGWIDLAPVPQAGQDQRQHLPGGVAVLHAVQGDALRAAAARRQLRLLLQQEALQAGRADRPAEDVLGADRVREEADDSKNGDGSLKVVGYDPNPTFYHGGAGIVAVRHARSARRTSTSAGKSNLARDPGWAQPAQLAEEPDRLLRLRQARASWQTGAGDEFSASHAFETGQARDDAGRRVARRVPQARASRARSTAPRRCRWTTRSRTCTAPATSTGRSSASRRAARTVTRPGSSSST